MKMVQYVLYGPDQPNNDLYTILEIYQYIKLNFNIFSTDSLLSHGP